MKKHMALPLLIVTVLILGTMFFKVSAWKEHSTFYINDILGERTALGNVAISGELLDGHHRTHFEITSDSNVKKTEIFSIPHFTQDGRFYLGKVIDDIEIEVHGKFNYYTMRYKDRSDPRVYISGGATSASPVRTSVNYEGPYRENSVTYTNQIEYGLTLIKDKIYFTIPTTNEYTGTNGIYEIDLNSQEEARAITTFSLDQNKEEGEPSLHVLGLERVGDRLALLLVEGDNLVIKGYDINGESIGEAIIHDFTLPDYNKDLASHYPNAEGHYEQYEAFSDTEEMGLNLIFRSTRSTEAEKKRTMISLDFSDRVKWIETIKANYMDTEQDYNYDITQMKHIDGKMYLVKTIAEKNEHIPLAIYDHRFLIYVYESGELIYEGELMTDRNDDLIRVMNRRDGYGHNPWEHRQYYGVKIERKSME